MSSAWPRPEAWAVFVTGTRNTCRRRGRIRSGAIIRIEQSGTCATPLRWPCRHCSGADEKRPRLFRLVRAAIISLKSLSEFPDQRGRDRLCGCRLVGEEVCRYAIDEQRKVVRPVTSESIFVAPVQARHGGHRNLGAAADETAAENVCWPREHSPREMKNITAAKSIDLIALRNEKKMIHFSVEFQSRIVRGKIFVRGENLRERFVPGRHVRSD